MTDLLIATFALAITSVLLSAALTLIFRDRGNHGTAWLVLLLTVPAYAAVVIELLA